MAASYNVGRNISVSRNGNKLTLTIDLSETGSISGTGKNMTIATTGAPTPIGDTTDGRPAKLSLTVFAPVPS